ncbi:MAG: hypothetical protein RQ875_06185 [Vicingaceae bacterium]|nr:hypothetical protein [Vicingaceae bacterium]
MIHYLFLSIYTLIILILGYKIWSNTKNIGFVLGILVLYYWSMLGSWFIVFDELTNQSGKEFGLAYYHYLEVLFPVHADNMYLKAIHFYAFFIITIELVVLYFLSKPISTSEQIEPEQNKSIYISHKWLITICIFCVFMSLGLIVNEILIAAKTNNSIYYITRTQQGRFFTLHQLLNQAAITALFVGMVTYISKEKAFYLKGTLEKKYLYLYFLTVFIVEGYLLMIGNKKEIFFGGLFGILVYLKNVNYKINYRWLSMFIIIIALPLVFNDGFRSYSPTFLAEYFDLSTIDEEIDIKEVSYTAFTAKNTIFRFLFSNEMFVPHFSMYGIISHDVPFTYGTSLVSLGASVVPRALWPNRPPGIYEYYAESVNATEGTGYTIHHAAAWYLNFGVIGIIIGAIIVGLLWFYLYKKSNQIQIIKNTFIKIFFIIGFSAFVAQLPILIRNGPEGYKALLIEGIVLPTLIIYFAYLMPKILKFKK